MSNLYLVFQWISVWNAIVQKIYMHVPPDIFPIEGRSKQVVPNIVFWKQKCIKILKYDVKSRFTP